MFFVFCFLFGVFVFVLVSYSKEERRACVLAFCFVWLPASCGDPEAINVDWPWSCSSHTCLELGWASWRRWAGLLNGWISQCYFDRQVERVMRTMGRLVGLDRVLWKCSSGRPFAESNPHSVLCSDEVPDLRRVDW